MMDADGDGRGWAWMGVGDGRGWVRMGVGDGRGWARMGAGDGRRWTRMLVLMIIVLSEKKRKKNLPDEWGQRVVVR